MRFHPTFLAVPALLLACVATTDPDGTTQSAATVGDSESDGTRPPPLMAALLPIDDSIDPTSPSTETKPPRPLIVPFVLPPKAEGSHCALVHLEPPKDGVAPPPPSDAPPPGETKPPKPPTLTVSSMSGSGDVTIAWSTPPAPEGEVAPKDPPLQLVQIALVVKPSSTDGPPPKPPADLLSCVVAKGETTITIARTVIDSLLAKPHATDASAAVAVAMFPPPPATPPAPPSGDGASMPKPPLGRGIVKLVAIE